MKKGNKKYVCRGCDTCEIKESCHRINGITHLVEMYVKWGGTFLFFVGSLLFATTLWAGNTPIIFLLFAVGHFSWIVSGYLMRDRSIISLNIMYFIFDISAIYIRL